jgi:hypothetical protein
MSNNSTIDELKAESDRAEHEYQDAMRARKAAVEASQAASKAAIKARSKYQRALGVQGAGGDGA